MKRFPSRATLVSLILLASASGGGSLNSDPRPPRYRIKDLGALPECDITTANEINDSGTIVGDSEKHIPPGHVSLPRPYVWRNGSITELEPGGDHVAEALTVNRAGDIGGYSYTSDHKRRAALWRRETNFRLVELEGKAGRVTVLSADGTPYGSSESDDGGARATRWPNGRMEVFGSADDAESEVRAVAGKVVAGHYVPRGKARSGRVPGDIHAVVWKSGAQIALPELFTQPSSESTGFRRFTSECNGANESGLIVGACTGADGSVACVWKEDKVEALPALRGFSTRAYAVNRHGDIVGEAMEKANRDSWKWLACLWRGRKIYDLNNLIPRESGWQLHAARSINEQGQIVGWGEYDKFKEHYRRAFLLTPIDGRD